MTPLEAEVPVQTVHSLSQLNVNQLIFHQGHT